jgi:type I restriction enzyme S subunit
MVPKGWVLSCVGNACNIKNNLRLPISSDERSSMSGEFPYYGPTGILGYINEYRIDEEFALIGEDGDHFLKYKDKEMTLLIAGKSNVNNHAHILKGKNGFDENSLFVLLNNTNISNIITGGVQAKISQTNLKTVKISIPPQYLIQALNKKLKPIFNLKIQTLEIQKICFKLKEILLSKMATIEG